METNNRSLEHKFANMTNEIQKLNDEHMHEELKEQEPEYTTILPTPSPSPASSASQSQSRGVEQFVSHLHPFESRMVENIKSNKPSYGRILLMAILANALFFMVWNIHKGYTYQGYRYY
eukprot:UN13722